MFYKMIWFCIFSLVAVWQQCCCFPNLQARRLPQVDIFSPAEVNNLSSEHEKRSINAGLLTQNDVEETIKEVQALLKANPSLPRLTRGEILDILENITKSDITKTKPGSLRNGIRDPKAIMVVMPYTPANPNDDKTIEDLYTKPPITQIIGNEPSTTQSSGNERTKNKRRPSVSITNTNDIDTDVNKYYHRTRTESKKVPSRSSTANKPKPTDFKFSTSKLATTERLNKAFTTEKPTTNTQNTKSASTTEESKISKRVRYTTVAPVYSSEALKSTTTRRNFRRKPPQVTSEKAETLATTYRPRTRRPIGRRPTSIASSTTLITTTTKYPNHKYPGESGESFSDFSKVDSPGSGLVVISPPQLIPADINRDFYDLSVQEDRQDEVVVTHEALSSFPPKESFVVTTEHLATKPYKNQVTTDIVLADKINIPEHLRTVVKDMSLESSLIDIPEDFHKDYDVTTHRPSTQDKKKIQSLLESLGIPPTTLAPTTTAAPDATNIADSLSPEMRDLLMSFGLLPDPAEEKKKKKVIPYNPEKAEVDPASYVGFKPLPEDGESRDEMESLLASFGLGRSSRRQKSLNRNKNDDRKNSNQLNFDVVPDAYKDIIKNIGFDLGNTNTGRQTVKINLEKKEEIPKPKQNKKEAIGSNDDVRNEEDEYATPEELARLENLMSIIKDLERLNRTITDEDLKKIDQKSLNELVGALNENSKIETLDQQAAPNPLNFDIGQSKNEVKRQELKLSGNVTVVTPSATDDAKGPSLEALEDSFGGKTTTTTAAPEPSTTTVRTGFYYLVDWNSFLDIDDQKGKRVNLRLQPTAGNPKNFLSVSVP